MGTYDQTNTRRHLISVPLTKSMLEDEIFDMREDEEVELGGAEFDETDLAYQNAKREPDTDDMVTKLFIEAEDVQNVEVGEMQFIQESKTIFTLLLCVLFVGSIGF